MPQTIDAFLTQVEEQHILNAIREAEQNTSGEIRIHLENDNHKKSSIERAKQVFFILKMHNTTQQNAVLIYVAVQDKSFVVYGDKSIHKVVGTSFWKSITSRIQKEFKKGHYANGLVQGVIEIGKQLKTHFPYSKTDENELSNTISK